MQQQHSAQSLHLKEELEPAPKHNLYTKEHPKGCCNNVQQTAQVQKIQKSADCNVPSSTHRHKAIYEKLRGSLMVVLCMLVIKLLAAPLLSLLMPLLIVLW